MDYKVQNSQTSMASCVSHAGGPVPPHSTEPAIPRYGGNSFPSAVQDQGSVANLANCQQLECGVHQLILCPHTVNYLKTGSSSIWFFLFISLPTPPRMDNSRTTCKKKRGESCIVPAILCQTFSPSETSSSGLYHACRTFVSP